MARTQANSGQIKGVDLSGGTDDVTGTLTAPNGGTGNATNTANAVLIGNGTGAITAVAPSTAANVLRSNGTVWQSLALVKGDVGLGSVDNTADSAKSVSSAATLTTPRTINGVSFNGSANIVIVDRNTTTNAPGATPSINTDTTDHANFTGVAANITSMTTNLTGTPSTGQKLMIRFVSDATPRTITWGASFGSSGVATLLATTAASKTHYVGLVYDGSVWRCLAVDGTGY